MEGVCDTDFEGAIMLLILFFLGELYKRLSIRGYRSNEGAVHISLGGAIHHPTRKPHFIFSYQPSECTSVEVKAVKQQNFFWIVFSD